MPSTKKVSIYVDTPSSHHQEILQCKKYLWITCALKIKIPVQGLGQWCYMALARLATEGFPVACEGDVDGALGCLVGKLLGCGAVYLSDWLEHDASQLTLWHGGMAPLQLRCNIGKTDNDI